MKKQRKLFYAKTADNAVVHVDYIETDKLREDLFCPFCNEKVLPRQGEKNVWHFSHYGEPCSHSFDRLEPEMRRMLKENQLLDEFVDGKKTIDIGEINIPQDSKEFQCPFCFSLGAKESGKKWKNDLYICTDCFSKLSGDMIEQLNFRTN